MALTQVSSKGIKDATLLNEDVNASADIAGSKLADNSISLAKLVHGDSNNNGKFLRANNGADPTFETIDLTALSASNLTSGTIPDARFPATLPAISGANLTNIPAANITGTLPAIDGSNLTGITSTIINTNAANRVITGSASANTLNGNADLIWNGSRLDIDTGGTEDALRIGNTAGTDTFIRLGSIGTNADTHAVIKYDKDDNYLSLLVSGESHGVGGVYIENGGKVRLPAGVKLGGTTDANLIDYYEEGTWTPVPALTYNPSGRSITLGTSTGTYTRIGRFVHVEFRAVWTSISGSGAYNVGVNNLPFSANNTVQTSGGSARSNSTGNMFVMENVNSSQINVIRKYNNTGPNTSDDIAGFAVYHI